MKRIITLTEEPAENGGRAFIAETTDSDGRTWRGLSIATAREIDAARDKSMVVLRHQMRALRVMLEGML